MPMTENTIDELMSLDPLKMTKDDINAVIAYHRKNRANAEAGIKPTKEKGPKSTINLLDKLGLSKPAEPALKRRVIE